MVASAWLPTALTGIAVLLLLGACWVAIRGLGGISALQSRQIVLTTRVEAIDERITREVKTRAGLASATKREEEASVLEQATQLLAAGDNVTRLPERPKRNPRSHR